MKQNRKKQKIYATTVTLALTAGVAAGVNSYRAGTQFQPSAGSRELKENRVSFSDNGEMSDQINGQDQDNSALWEQDQNVREEAEDAAYLFEQLQKQLQQEATSVKIADNEDPKMPDAKESEKQSQQDPKEPVYNITDKKSDADTVIKANPQNPSGQQNGNGNGNGKDNNGGNGTTPSTPETDNNGGTSDTEKPSTPDRPETPDTSDNSGDHGNGGNTKPTTPASTAKDPQVIKPRPAISEVLPSESYDEDKVTSDTVDILVGIREGSNSEGVLYKGQSIDEHLLFCALDTYVFEKNSTKVYLWGESDYGKYIKITGVSFDGGKTWKTSYPVTIPETVGEEKMCIRVEYRLSLKKGWEEMSVVYHPRDTRFFLLSRKLEQENEELTSDMILNGDQYPDPGSSLNLLQYLASFLGWDRLNAVFPGWTEDGKEVSWNYEVKAGRHLLEPSDLIPLDPSYVLMIRFQWILPNGRVDVDNESLTGEYCPLQTLTGLDVEVSEEGRKYLSDLKVPEYIQAVCMEEPVETDTLQIPDTVIYVQNNGKNLRVNKAYIVDSKNRNYTAVQGVLMDKEKTQILGIPYDMEKITVPKKITKVNITEDNQIHEINIQADSIDELPKMESEKLQNCKVVVADEILDDVLKLYGEKLAQHGNCIAARSNPDRTYTMINGMVTDNEGELYKIFGYEGIGLRIPSYVASIGSGAFEQADHVKTLIWPRDKEIELKADSFTGSSIKKIICYTQEQVENLTADLERLGIKDITVYISKRTSDGYGYYSEGEDGEVVTTLTDAPSDLQEFDGKIENGTISVNIIEANAFSDCSELKWVTLPEEVGYIGYQAFRNCSALEGIMIESTDSITIGNQAFEGCDSLRFVASNAPKAVMEGGYDPKVINKVNYDGMTQYSFFFVPQGAEGYGSYANQLLEYKGIGHYEVCDQGSGNKVLYATDEQGSCWLALRSAKTLTGQVNLPSETTQFFAYSFSDSKGTDGSYQINWEELRHVNSIQECAFSMSQLSGDVIIGSGENAEGIYLRNYAFARCENLESVTVKDTLRFLGQQVFESDASLKRASFADITDAASFYAGMFSECDQMETLEMNSSNPVQLTTYGTVKYQFNYNWTVEEEAEHLKLIVPAGAVNDYIMQWRYLFAGSTGTYSGSTYLDLWNDVQGELIDWDTGMFPTDEEVDAEAKERLLQAENRLRKMCGVDLVSEPTDLYQYRLVGINLTLVGVPSYSQNIELSPETVDLPEGWYLDDIAAGAFSGADHLQSITIPDSMVGITSGVLSGAAEQSSQVTLHFQGKSPLTLKGYGQDNPFTFGIEESKVRIQVPDGREKAYIGEWTYPMAGYGNQSEMESAVTEILTEDGQEVTEELLQEKMVELLMPVENRLRKMMGMDIIEDPEDLISYGYVPEEETETETETENESESESESENETDIQESESQAESSEESETNRTEESEPQTEETETEASEPQTEESEPPQTEMPDTDGSQETGGSSEEEKTTEAMEIVQETEFEVVFWKSQEEKRV